MDEIKNTHTILIETPDGTDQFEDK